MHRGLPRPPRQHSPLRRRPREAFLLSLVLLFVIFVPSRRRRHEAAQSSSPPSAVVAHLRAVDAPSRSEAPTIILTTSNWMYRSLLHNFACTLRRLPGAPRPVVHALDARTHEFATSLGLTSALSRNATSETASQPGKFARTGPLSFDAITKEKLRAARDALRSGVDVLLSDGDIFWCADARPVLRRILERPDYADADVLVQPEAGYRTLNSGFYFARATSAAVALFDALVDHAGIGHHDQDVLNHVFCNARFGGSVVRERYGDGGHVPFSCRSRGAVIRVLDARLFPSGAQPVPTSDANVTQTPIFSLPRDELAARCARGDFVVLHNNFIRADKKVARLIVKGMWFLQGEDDAARCTPEAVDPTARALRTCGAYC